MMGLSTSMARLALIDIEQGGDAEEWGKLRVLSWLDVPEQTVAFRAFGEQELLLANESHGLLLLQPSESAPTDDASVEGHRGLDGSGCKCCFLANEAEGRLVLAAE